MVRSAADHLRIFAIRLLRKKTFPSGSAAGPSVKRKSEANFIIVAPLVTTGLAFLLSDWVCQRTKHKAAFKSVRRKFDK